MDSATTSTATRPPRGSDCPSSPPKRVALFTGAYNHIADGVSLTLNRLVEHLEQQGAEVRIFAPTVDDPPIDHAGSLVSAPSVPLPGRSDYHFTLGLSSSMRRELEAFDPTLVHIATPDLLGQQALSFAQSANTPVVASYHTHFSSYLKYYHLGLLESALWSYLRRFYQQCEHIYVPSTAIGAALEEHGITDGLRLWQRGVSTDRFTPRRRSSAWRQVRGINDNEVVVTFVSRLVWEKGLDVYARVIRQLEDRDIPHRSLIVGDGPAREDLERRLPNTTFTGFLEGDDLARAYASSDIFLFPSDTETFGNVTLEAMASGLPTVGADAAGSRDLVNHEETGLLCEPGNVAAFTEATRRIILDTSLRTSMGRAAYRRTQDFTWDAILSKMNRYYDQILGRSVSSSSERARTRSLAVH
ncbi:MAG: glycosyl transferase family 1 [Bacteroidetes bacterium SW_9_63_38]|nr:MAG: glycosyl transferase family 1 [Bacteroidetes bacterium SW_9_63_38]